jgi:hypothetical protein
MKTIVIIDGKVTQNDAVSEFESKFGCDFNFKTHDDIDDFISKFDANHNTSFWSYPIEEVVEGHLQDAFGNIINCEDFVLISIIENGKSESRLYEW